MFRHFSPLSNEEGEGREQIKGEMMKSILKLPVSILFVVLVASAALAQQRTFVSGAGSDTNPCTFALPCRTFTKAESVTDAGGEVAAVDAAEYDPFTIVKSISIEAPAGATISVPSGGDGVTINAATGSEVVLRGLTINAEGGGRYGIHSDSNVTLHIENCVVSGFAAPGGAGVEFDGSGKLLVKETVVRGNRYGISLNPAGGFSLAALDGVSLNSNFLGLILGGSGNVEGAIRGSSIIGNANYGIEVYGSTSGTAYLDVESCLIANNAYGLLANSPSWQAGMSISNSLISHNVTAGWNQLGGGFIGSRGNNSVVGNGPSSPTTLKIPTPNFQQ
jgi:nitrous oxidase accessory protein NosD